MPKEHWKKLQKNFKMLASCPLMEKVEVLIGQQWVEVLAKLSDDCLTLSIDESSEGGTLMQASL